MRWRREMRRLDSAIMIRIQRALQLRAHEKSTMIRVVFAIVAAGFHYAAGAGIANAAPARIDANAEGIPSAYYDNASDQRHRWHKHRHALPWTGPYYSSY